MRVRFGELSIDEAFEKERMCIGARSAWRHLRQGDDARACELIQLIDSRLALAVRRDTDGGPVHAELTAFDACAWPLAELLLAQAPVDFDCVLSLGRMAVPLEQALAEVLGSHDVDLSTASLRAGFGRGHLLELTLALPGGSGAESEQNAAENLTRALLGDRLFETWIGAVHATAAARRSSLRVLTGQAPVATLELRDLYDTVAAAVLGVLQGLPALPLAGESRASSGLDSPPSVDASDDEARQDWTMLEIEPVEDARGERKDDLVLASTCTPELLRCFLDGSPCASRRFSRAGELFVFVSYEDHERSLKARLGRRAAIESALSTTLGGDGAVTGVGFGVHTSYVDVALCHPESGLRRLVSKLRELDAPARTFIQFFDSELAEEWLSIWPDSRLTEG